MLKKLRQLASAARLIVFGRYEAARQWYGGSRSLIFSPLQDARRDVNSGDRRELLRLHNHFIQNSYLVAKIENLFVQFSVGTNGLAVTPMSSDQPWNDSRQRGYDQWCEAPDLGSNLSMGQLEIQWARQLFSGEVFIHLTQDALGQPRVQSIDPIRVETPPGMAKQEGISIIDGIELTPLTAGGRAIYTGKPAAYWVRDEFKSELHQRIPAAAMLHLFKARRPGQMRGIPEGVTAFNTLRDYEDLHLLEMKAAKAAAGVANVIKNASGEFDPAELRRVPTTINSTNAAGTAVAKPSAEYARDTVGGDWLALKMGEDVMQLKSERPSVVTQNYWDLLVTEICCAYNVPKLLVMPFSLQGTVTRADLDICTNAFRSNFEILAEGILKIYRWQTQWAVRFDRSLDGKPPRDFLAAFIRPPRAPNVDIGRNAQALMLELEAGTITYQDVFAERQQDWRQQFRQAAEAESFIDALAAQYGLAPQRIASKLKVQPPDPNEPEPDPNAPPTAGRARHSVRAAMPAETL